MFQQGHPAKTSYLTWFRNMLQQWAWRFLPHCSLWTRSKLSVSNQKGTHEILITSISLITVQIRSLQEGNVFSLSFCSQGNRGSSCDHGTVSPSLTTTQEGPPQDLFKLVHLENPLPHTCSNLGTPWTNSSLFTWGTPTPKTCSNLGTPWTNSSLVTWGTPTPKTCSNLFIWGPPDLFKFVHLGNQHPLPYLLESGRLAFDRKAFMLIHCMTALNR